MPLGMLLGSALGAGAVQAGSSILGGLIGRRSAKKQDEANYRRQEEFAKHGVQWKVEDAKAAGLHPLFALNASTPTYSPMAHVDTVGPSLAQAGQDLGRAAYATQNAKDRNLTDQLLLAQIKAANAGAMRDEAAAAASWSEVMRRQQPGQSGPAFPDVVTNAYGSDVAGVGNIAAHPLFRDAVKPQPAEQISRSVDSPGVTANLRNPGYSEYISPDGSFKFLLPATKSGEPPEDLDATRIPDILAANIQKYGWRWLPNYARYITGQKWTREWNLERKVWRPLTRQPFSERDFSGRSNMPP